MMNLLSQTCHKLFVLFGIFLTLCISYCHSQAPSPAPQTIEEALHHMSDLAGIIFVGEVTAIRDTPGQQGASGIVEIDFRIDQALRGCTAGSTYTLREWAGLWEAGDQRYRIGQRLLMMLHSPTDSGVSSPVDGMNGAIPIVPPISSSPTSGSPNSGSQMLATAASATPPPFADLRWIAAQLARPAPYTTPGAQVTAESLPSILPATTLDQAQQTPLPAVVQMLASWQKAMP
jgi:hypothetical protein